MHASKNTERVQHRAFTAAVSEAVEDSRSLIRSGSRMDDLVLSAFGASHVAHILRTSELESWRFGNYRRGDSAILREVTQRVAKNKSLQVVEYAAGTSWGQLDENYGAPWISRVLAQAFREYDVEVSISDLRCPAPYAYRDLVLGARDSSGTFILFPLLPMAEYRGGVADAKVKPAAISPLLRSNGSLEFQGRSLKEIAAIDRKLAGEIQTQLTDSPFKYLCDPATNLALFIRPAIDPEFEKSFGIKKALGGVSFDERAPLPLADVGFIRYFPSMFANCLGAAKEGLRRQLAPGGIGLISIHESEEPIRVTPKS